MTDSQHAPDGKGWTHETLYRYFYDLINSNDRRYTESLGSSKVAIDKAETATEKRLEGMNEFRDALKDSDQENVKQPQYKADMDGMRTKIDTAFSLTGKRMDDLASQVTMLISLVNDATTVAQAGKAGRSEGWKDIALFISIAVAALAIASRFMP